MNLRSFVNKAKVKKKGIFVILGTGFGVVALVVLSPLPIINILLGIFFIIYGIDYYKHSNTKKAFPVLSLCFLIGVINLGIIVFLYANASASSNWDGETYTYRQDNLILDGRVWDYEHSFQNEYGETDYEGTLYVPKYDYITYFIPSQSGITFEIQFRTSVKFENNKVTFTCLTGDTGKASEAEAFIKDELNMTYFSDDEFIYQLDYYGSNIYEVDSDENRDSFFFFRFSGEVDSVQNESFTFSSEIEIIPSDVSGDFGYSEKEMPDLGDILNDQIERNLFFTTLLLVSFIITFLVLWVTGRAGLIRYFLIIILMIALILLFVNILDAENLPIISTILDILRLFEFVDDLSGINVIGWLTAFVLFIGWIIAILFWGLTIGATVGLCFFLVYLWTKILGEFIPESLLTSK